MKVLKQMVRLGTFLALALVLSFAIIVVDIVAIPLALDYSDDYAGGVSFPAMLVVALAVVMLFNKIVLKKAIKNLFITLIFYIACNAIAVLMVAIEEPDLAPAFAWTGVMGIIAGYIIVKTKKNQAV